MKINEIVNKYTTPDDFIKAVEEQLLLLAKEQPDFRYSTSDEPATCRYNGPATITDLLGNKSLAGLDCKGCIFGQALQKLGWDDTRELSCASAIDHLIRLEDNESSKRLLMWRSIQSEQDRGKTWSEAVSLLSANAPATGENN